MKLMVKLLDGRSDSIAVPEGATPDGYLQLFLTRTGQFNQEWVKLASGEYVRYDQIASVRPPRDEPVSGPPVR